LTHRRRLKLLPREALVKTGEVDHADWNCRPFLGLIQRERFRQALSLLPSRRSHRLLEIGYGSGVFMPELLHHCDELYGIDIHKNGPAVSNALARFNTKPRLLAARAEALPFRDGHFDTAVAISSLEFVENLERACVEIKRVLKPSGLLVMVTPGHSPIVDLGLKLLTGKSAHEDYGNKRQSLMQTILNHFRIQQQRTVPPIGGISLRLYTALRLGKRT
jgi:ubiquinone/menaquinone biosynthesis C-methylase UbiE